MLYLSGHILPHITLVGDKVSTITHTYSHTQSDHMQNVIIRLTVHFMCGLIPDLVICKFIKNMVIHDIECPHCDHVS